MDNDDQWLTGTDSDDSSSESSDSRSDSSDDYSDSGEFDTWGSYSGTSNNASSSASSSAPDVQKQEMLVEYVCGFCKGVVEDIGRMIAQLSEIIRRTEEEALRNHGTGDESETEEVRQ